MSKFPPDNIVLEEEIDVNYEPTEEELLEYATWLGMNLPEESELLWVAREGLKAPLPEHWKPCRSEDDEIYYFNFQSGESVWEHPCDDYYSRGMVVALEFKDQQELEVQWVHKHGSNSHMKHL
jgi:centrosomal protein CEP164